MNRIVDISAWGRRWLTIGAILFVPAAMFGQCDLTWNGSFSNDWSTPANWTPNGAPTSSTNICIDNPGQTATAAGVNSAAANLTITSNSTLNFVSGSLGINGATVSNSGTLKVANSFLGFLTATTLNGGGAIELSQIGTSSIAIGSSAALTNSDNTIEGYGNLVPVTSTSAFTNGVNGIVNANSQGLTLNVQGFGFGTLANQGTMEATNGGKLTLGGVVFGTSSSSSVNNVGGTILASGQGSEVDISGYIQGGTLKTTGSGSIVVTGPHGSGGPTLIWDGTGNSGGLFNAGNLNVGSSDVLLQSGNLQNTGSMLLNSSSQVQFVNAGLSGNGSITLADGSTMTVLVGAIVNDGNTIVLDGGAGGNSNPTNRSSSLNYEQNSGEFDLQTGASVHGGIGINGGTAIIDGVITGTLGAGTNFSGELEGTGIISGRLLDDGIVHPGDSTGMLTLNGNYQQDGTGIFDVDIGGLSDFSELMVNGSASLDGSLDVSLADGYTPNLGDTFTILDSETLSGTFAELNGLDEGNVVFDIVYKPDSVELVVVSTTAPEPGTWLLSAGSLIAAFLARLNCPRIINRGSGRGPGSAGHAI